MRTLVILLLILCWFVGDIYTSAGIYCYIRHRQGIGIRDKQGADAVVVDGQFLNPLPVDFLSLIDLNVIDQLVYHGALSSFRCSGEKTASRTIPPGDEAALLAGPAGRDLHIQQPLSLCRICGTDPADRSGRLARNGAGRRDELWGTVGGKRSAAGHGVFLYVRAVPAYHCRWHFHADADWAE